MPLIDKGIIKLQLFVDQNTPKYLVHDALKIHQILVNIISNAVKYTKSGTICLVIDWIADVISPDTAPGKIRYTVSDSGQGIKKEKKKTLFKFLSSSGDGESKNSTTSLAGTGLSISQKIAEKLGSKIDFVSSTGIGSKFWFDLDITEHETPEQERKERPKKPTQIEFSNSIRSKSVCGTEEVDIAVPKKLKSLLRKRSFDDYEDNSQYEVIEQNDKSLDLTHSKSFKIEKSNNIAYKDYKKMIKPNSQQPATHPKMPKLSAILEKNEEIEDFNSEIDFTVPHESHEERCYVRRFDISASISASDLRLSILDRPLDHLEKEESKVNTKSALKSFSKSQNNVEEEVKKETKRIAKAKPKVKFDCDSDSEDFDMDNLRPPPLLFERSKSEAKPMRSLGLNSDGTLSRKKSSTGTAKYLFLFTIVF